MSLVPNHEFNKYAARHNGDDRIKELAPSLWLSNLCQRKIINATEPVADKWINAEIFLWHQISTGWGLYTVSGRLPAKENRFISRGVCETENGLMFFWLFTASFTVSRSHYHCQFCLYLVFNHVRYLNKTLRKTTAYYPIDILKRQAIIEFTAKKRVTISDYSLVDILKKRSKVKRMGLSRSDWVIISL
jgi:hypothetical protein